MTKPRRILQRLKNKPQPTAADRSNTGQSRARIRADNPISNTDDDTLGNSNWAIGLTTVFRSEDRRLGVENEVSKNLEAEPYQNGQRNNRNDRAQVLSRVF